MVQLGYVGGLAWFLVCSAAIIPGAASAQVQVGPDAATTQEQESAAPKIKVKGNQRVERSTILRYAGLADAAGLISDNLALSDKSINEAVKALYRSGFFAEVAIKRRDNTLIIEVQENPSINKVVFRGNEQLEEDKLRSEIQIRPRSIYTRPKVQADVERLLSLYRRSGRFSANVTPKLKTLEQNRVNVVFDISEGEVTRIGHVSFVGNEQFSDETLQDVIETSTGCWYCFLSETDTYDPDRVAYDKELLRRFYTTQGYADFAVKSLTAELSPEKDAFFITFNIEEGKRYRIGEVNFDSRLDGTSAEALREHIQTRPGDLFNSRAMEQSIDGLVDHLGDKGFAFVDISPELDRQRDGTVDITYEIAEGPRVYVDRINIEGNMRTLDKVVRREFRLSEGDPYSTSKLQRTEQRLRNLGFFKDVKIDTSRSDERDRVNIDVEVEEQSTGEVSFGAGFSTVDGLLTNFGITERNLLGKGQRLRLNGTLAAERQQFDIGFTEPYFLGRDVSAGVDVFQRTRDLRQESSFDRRTVGGQLRFGYALTENLRQNWRYSFREVQVQDVSPNASRFIRDQKGVNVTSLIGQSLTYDTRNNRFQPTDGYMVSLDLDVAGLGGDSEFVRPEFNGSFYYSFVPKWTIMLGASGGYVMALNDRIAIQDRFFLGGRRVRGFDNGGIGPRDLNTGDALGGNAYYTGTAELLFPLGLPEDLGFRGAIFADTGSLFDVDETGAEVADQGSIRASAGVGIAWNSPFGPVRLDFSQALIKEDYDVEEVFRFNFGTRF